MDSFHLITNEFLHLGFSSIIWTYHTLESHVLELLSLNLGLLFPFP